MLTQEQLSWIDANLSRGCAPDVMSKDLSAATGLSYEDALRQIHGRMNKEAVAKSLDGSIALPRINTSSNLIQTSDRQVEVLFKLNSPCVIMLGNVLSDEECDEMIALAQPRFSRSMVVNNLTGKPEEHPARTSHGAMFQRGEFDVITRVENRLAEIANWPVDHAEGMQLQKYGISNEYQPHYDWYDPTNEGSLPHLQVAGQRLATFVLYLSDVESGGSTQFPKLGLDLHPKKGCAAFFMDVDESGKPDTRNLHAGMPVISGEKIIANKWLRERKF